MTCSRGQRYSGCQLIGGSKEGYGKPVFDVARMARGLGCMLRTIRIQAKTLGEDAQRP